MRYQKQNRRSSMGSGEIMMWVAGVLFCLVLISTAMMGGLYARYTTQGSSWDSARVIKFGNIRIEEDGDFEADGSMLIVPGKNIRKEAKVQFEGSEAATYVFLQVTCTGKWTATNGVYSNSGMLTWTLADGWEPVEGHSGVYYRTLAPNTGLDADIIKDQVITVSADIDPDAITALNGDISFRASAIQSSGFTSPGAAWNSLRNKEVS